MDTVWVDTMFPGIDPDDGWEKNLERVVNYDYLLKEYLDWQLKHLNTDNMDPVDWANVQAEIISMAAGQIDLTAYYTKDEVDAVSASLQLYADESIASLSLAAVTSGGTAKLVLQSAGTTIENSGAALALSVTNNEGNSVLQLTSGGITLATSGQINLGGNVIFSSTNIGSNAYKNTAIRTGVASIIDGVVTADYVNALGITADSIVANASITSPYINGGTIKGVNIYSADSDSFFGINSEGWYLQQKSGNTWYTRAILYQSTNEISLTLGNNEPVLIKKYYTSSKHYMWIGNDDMDCGLKFNFTDGTYHFYGTAN